MPTEVRAVYQPAILEISGDDVWQPLEWAPMPAYDPAASKPLVLVLQVDDAIISAASTDVKMAADAVVQLYQEIRPLLPVPVPAVTTTTTTTTPAK